MFIQKMLTRQVRGFLPLFNCFVFKRSEVQFREKVFSSLTNTFKTSYQKHDRKY